MRLRRVIWFDGDGGSAGSTGFSGGKSEEKIAMIEKDLIPKKLDQSWVSVAQDKKALKKYDVEIVTKEGRQTVVIPDEVISDSTPLWEDFVIGKFLDLAPHVAKVHMVLNKIWRYGDLEAKIEVYEVNETTMRFKISDKKAREKVLRRGMWNIVGVPMVVTKWTPRAEEEEQEEDAIPMWIHVTKVPLHMFSWEGLSLIASPVGFPVKLHPETLSCKSFEVAKVFVKVDVSKALPKEMNFSKEGKEFTVEFHYPWIPSRCKYCNKWGHGEKVCAAKRKDKEKDKGGGSNLKVKSGSKEAVENKDINVNDTEEVTVEESNLEKENVEENKVDEKECDPGIKSWAHVSPGKASKSQLKTPLRNVAEIQISASKFSVLSLVEVEEGEINEDMKENEEEEVDVDSKMGDLEDEIMGNFSLEKNNGKEKSVKKRGRKKGQKASTRDANPVKSTRSSRHHN